MLGQLVSGGLSLIGGLLGQNTQAKQAKANRAAQQDVLHHGIEYRVADARRAGIHPAAALGAQISSPAPIAIGDSLSPALHNAGQDISRAINAGAKSDDRSTAAYTGALQALQLEKLGLENAEIRSRLTRANAPGTPPPVPTPESTSWLTGPMPLPNVPGTVTDGPLARTGVDPRAPHHETGAIADVGYARSAPGGMEGYYPVYGKDVQERMEDDHIGSILWNFRNRGLPFFNLNRSIPYPPPNGMWWEFNPIRGYFLQGEPLSDTRNYRHR